MVTSANYLIVCLIVFTDKSSGYSTKGINSKSCGLTGPIRRIFGGHEANLGQFPWTARLGYRNKKQPEYPLVFDCGGALISKRYVLTAAHCILADNEDDSRELVRLGEYNVSTNPDCRRGVCADPVQDFKINETMKHQRFSVVAMQDDIALLRLNKRAKFTSWVRPICLPYKDTFTNNLTNVVVDIVGWGVSGYGPQQRSLYKDTLLTVKVPIVNKTICIEHFQKPLNVGQFCAGGVSGKDSCNGDSGGPVVKSFEAKDGVLRYFLLGVVSFGHATCGGDIPAVYANVSYYTDWILNHIS